MAKLLTSLKVKSLSPQPSPAAGPETAVRSCGQRYEREVGHLSSAPSTAAGWASSRVRGRVGGVRTPYLLVQLGLLL